MRTYSGRVYAAFIIDVYLRMVVGWQPSKNLYTDLGLGICTPTWALDALNVAIWQRAHASDDLSGLIHHSDRGVAEYIDWFGPPPVHGEIGYVPPSEYEAQHAAVEPPPEPVDDLADAR